jgi:hypothetical protein
MRSRAICLPAPFDETVADLLKVAPPKPRKPKPRKATTASKGYRRTKGKAAG